MTDQPTCRLQVFSIFDKIAKAYMPPFFMPNIGMAIRAFGDDCRNPQGNLFKHSADFELHHIGEFNDFSGLMVARSGGTSVISRASDFSAEVR